MTADDVLSLAPLAIAAAAAVVLLIMISVKRHFATAAGFSMAVAVSGLAAIVWAAKRAPRPASALLRMDGYALFFIGLFFAAALVIFLSASSYFRRSAKRREEFFAAAFIALLGSSVLAASVHFVTLFLGLEMLSVSLYVLISFPLDRKGSIEGGLKYLVLASASGAILLFGAAIVYGETGGLDFATWAARAAAGAVDRPLFVLGVSLMIVGIGFKLAVVPFHMWTPDIYQGAPAPSSALVATISKGGMLAFLFRFFWTIDLGRFPSLGFVFALMAGASMIAGNLLALRQSRLKRILAYSSISHMGYILVAFLAGGVMGLEAGAFYLAAYVVTMTAAFGAVAVLSPEAEDADALEGFRGIFWTRPATAAVLALAMLSLAGMPLTAGFMGKFYVVTAGAGSSLWALVIVLAATSVAGLYYYLRVLVIMFAHPKTAGEPPVPTAPGARRASLPAGIGLAVLALLLLALGLAPSGAIDTIRTAVTTIVGPTQTPGNGGCP